MRGVSRKLPELGALVEPVASKQGSARALREQQSELAVKRVRMSEACFSSGDLISWQPSENRPQVGNGWRGTRIQPCPGQNKEIMRNNKAKMGSDPLSPRDF